MSAGDAGNTGKLPFRRNSYLVGDPGQHRLEDNAGQLQRAAFEVEHVAVGASLQRKGDHVGSKQRLESRVVIVTLGRDLGQDLVALAGVIPDECKAGIAAADFTLCGVDHAAAGAMNGVKFNLVETVPQFAPQRLQIFSDSTLWPGHAPNNPADRNSRRRQHHISVRDRTGR